GKTFEEHQQRLELVFQRLRSANLTLKPSKCTFGESKIPYLGHVISRDGISVDPEKVSAISKFPVPKSLTDIRSFVNMCGYYRRFVHKFSEIASPLNLLLRKDQPFVWADEQEQAFETLKAKLVCSPILGYPMEEAPTSIHCDSS